ncbi:hypothetical protein D3C73_1227360 [compost metagenome]
MGLACQTSRQKAPFGVSACLLAASTSPLILTAALLQPASVMKQRLYWVSDSSPSKGPITRLVIRHPSMVKPMEHSETVSI